ncbi:hypothetical protein P692DRAFT_20839687 [Suillus brevipes Sb2]|nr:hypothetical protein P692DRAFT_20839687 [Suillus brevipes Sb2]
MGYESLAFIVQLAMRSSIFCMTNLLYLVYPSSSLRYRQFERLGVRNRPQERHHHDQAYSLSLL